MQQCYTDTDQIRVRQAKIQWDASPRAYRFVYQRIKCEEGYVQPTECLDVAPTTSLLSVAFFNLPNEEMSFEEATRIRPHYL